MECRNCGTLYSDRLNCCPTCGNVTHESQDISEIVNPYTQVPRGWYIFFLIRTILSGLANLGAGMNLHHVREELQSGTYPYEVGTVAIVISAAVGVLFLIAFLLLLRKVRFGPQVLIVVELIAILTNIGLGVVYSDVVRPDTISIGVSIAVMIIAKKKFLPMGFWN